MKINFDTPLVMIDGVTKATNNGEEISISSIVVSSLLESSSNIDADEKTNRFKVAVKVSGGNNEYYPEEAVLIKKCVGEICTTLVVGRVYELIDNS